MMNFLKSFKSFFTVRKELEKYKERCDFLSYLILALPGHVYWKDLEGKILFCNESQAKSAGMSVEEFIGKTDYDYPWSKQADSIRKMDLEVISSNKSLELDEALLVNNNEKKIFHSKKVPFKDAQGKTIGVLGISFDVTEDRQKEDKAKKEKFEAEQTLNELISILPAHIFWYNVDGILLGCNDVQAKAFGYNSAKEMIGTSIYQQKSQDNEDLELLRKVNKRIIETGEMLSAEEPLKYPDGTEAIFLSNKVPLRDSNGKVTGILGISMNISDRKDKERLEIEKETQLKFKTKAQQVAHDINSPLGGLMMIIARMDPKKPMSESDRLSLQEALGDIKIVADELLNYDKIEANPEAHKDKPQVLPMSVTLAQFLAVKKSEYKNIPIKLESKINEKAYAAFIKAEPTALKRSLSNIINNAKDAFEGKAGTIKLKLDATKTQVKITVEDNGKGMPPEIVEKIMSKISVTSDKADGHGFGMAQVSDTLARNQGSLSIDSTVGKGTKVILTFPRINAPQWFADELMMGPEDIIVVVDDDGTMHKGWDARFAEILAAQPKMRMEHFEEGEAAIAFITKLSAADKPKIFLLTDYELLGQHINGLDVVEKSQVSRAFLVTSHYGKADIQARAIELDTKIIPKQSAVEIPIKIEADFDYNSVKPNDVESEKEVIDVLVVDDNQSFAKQLKMHFSFFGKVAKCYSDPRVMLKEVEQYPKDIKICIDNNFEGDIDMKGIEVAAKLHEMGFTSLYLLSGDAFKPGELPDYLTPVLKSDPEFVGKIFP